MKLNQVPGTGKTTVTCTYCGAQFERYASQQINPTTGELRKIVKCKDCRSVPWQKRFESMVDKSGGDDACWPFTGGLNKDGYGHFPATIDGKFEQRSNRLAFILWVGPIPQGLHVLHRCKQSRACCNPKHLYPDTQSENTLGSVRDGTHYFKNHPGEAHYNAKITEEAVRDIRANYRYGMARGLAEKWGIATATVRGIGQGRSWKHVT
jgi:hypothetical protein